MVLSTGGRTNENENDLAKLKSEMKFGIKMILVLKSGDKCVELLNLTTVRCSDHLYNKQ